MFSPFGFNPYYSSGYPGVWRDPFEDLLDEEADIDFGETPALLQIHPARLSKAARRKQKKLLKQQQQGADVCAECSRQLQQQYAPTIRGREQGGGQLTQTGGTSALALPQTFQRPLDVQLSEENDRFVLRASLSGVPQDKVNLSIDNGSLNLSAVRQHTAQDQQSSFSFSETLSRSFPLPAGVNEDQIQANWRDGQLEVIVPKPAERQQQAGGRKIAISGTSASQEKMQQAATAQSQQQSLSA